MTRAGTLPATVSPKIVDGLLRRELAYDGLVVSDAFDMGGLSDHFDAGEAAVRAIEAGEDQILLSPNPDAAIAAVKAAVRSGRISEARIDQSVRRILAAKEFAGVPHATPEEIFRIIDSKEHRDLANEIARRAATLVKDDALLPIRKSTPVLLAVVSDFSEINPLPDFERELRARAPVVKSAMIDARTREDELPAIVAASRNAEVAVIGFAIRARSGAGSIAVPPAGRRLVEMLKIPLIGIAFGTPYLIREVPAVSTYICAYGIQPVMQVAVTKAMFGEEKFLGRLPVTP